MTYMTDLLNELAWQMHELKEEHLPPDANNRPCNSMAKGWAQTRHYEIWKCDETRAKRMLRYYYVCCTCPS